MTVFTNSLKPNPYVSLFPSFNMGGVVRLDNVFKISCFQPATVNNVHIEYSQPRLFKNKCISCEYLEPTDLIKQDGDPSIRTCEGFLKMSRYKNETDCKKNAADKLEIVKVNVPSTMWVVNSNNTFKLYTIKTVGGVLYKYPYTLANVYSNGDICWGRSNKLPRDLKDASNTYWSLPFNSDLMVGNRDEADLSTKLSTFNIDNSDANVLSHWHDCSEIFGNACVYRQTQVAGVSVWFDEETLDLLPSDKIYTTKRVLKGGTTLTRCAVGWVNHLPNSLTHIIDFDGFKIIKDKLTIKSKPTVLGQI